MTNMQTRFITRAQLLTVLLVGMLWLGLAQTASADLIGVTANVCTNSVYTGAVTTNPAACDPLTVQLVPSSAVIVNPGVEFSSSGGVGDRFVDFTNTTVSVIYGPNQGS